MLPRHYGSPQRTVLGCMFWLLHFHSLNFDYNILNYSDSLSLKSKITDNISQPARLQCYITQLAHWCRDQNNDCWCTIFFGGAL